MELALRPVPLSELGRGDNLFQSPFWGSFKSHFGWTPHGFRFEGAVGSGKLLVLSREIGGGRGMAYVPEGPDVPLRWPQQGPLLEGLSRLLRPHLPAGCVFLRYDLPWETPYALEGRAAEARALEAGAAEHAWAAGGTSRGGPGGTPGGAPSAADDPGSGDPRPAPPIREIRMNFGTSDWNLRKSPTDLLPPDTVVVDLEKDDDGLLAAMSSTARYNVRMSARRGVSVKTATEAELPAWHRLYTATTRRHGIEHHPLSYFRTLLRAADSEGGADTDIQLLLAKVGGSLAAGMLLALQGRQALYLFGASSLRHRGLAPSHRLQWRAMKLARDRGCTRYDLFGIPPSRNPAHPMHGLFRFKTGFGGTILHRRGCWDYPFDSQVYGQVRGWELAGEGFHRRGS